MDCYTYYSTKISDGISCGINKIKILFDPQKTCKFPNCKKPCYIQNGTAYDFCGLTHAKEYNSINQNKNFKSHENQ